MGSHSKNHGNPRTQIWHIFKIFQDTPYQWTGILQFHPFSCWKCVAKEQKLSKYVSDNDWIISWEPLTFLKTFGVNMIIFKMIIINDSKIRIFQVQMEAKFIQWHQCSLFIRQLFSHRRIYSLCLYVTKLHLLQRLFLFHCWKKKW